jgi:hypothetical protein
MLLRSNVFTGIRIADAAALRVITAAGFAAA